MDVKKLAKANLNLRVLVPTLRQYDERWPEVMADDISTYKYPVVKKVSDLIDKLLIGDHSYGFFLNVVTCLVPNDGLCSLSYSIGSNVSRESELGGSLHVSG